MLGQHQENETVGLERNQKLQEEKRILQERITGLQRAIAQLDSEKRETQRGAVRLEKDKSALQKTLDKVGAAGCVLFKPSTSYEMPHRLNVSA